MVWGRGMWWGEGGFGYSEQREDRQLQPAQMHNHDQTEPIVALERQLSRNHTWPQHRPPGTVAAGCRWGGTRCHMPLESPLHGRLCSTRAG